MKREFALEDAMRMLEVLWSALPTVSLSGELQLYEVSFPPPSPPPNPNVKQIRQNAYTKVCAIRRLSSSLSTTSSNKKKNQNGDEKAIESTEKNSQSDK